MLDYVYFSRDISDSFNPTLLGLGLSIPSNLDAIGLGVMAILKSQHFASAFILLALKEGEFVEGFAHP